MAYGLQFSATWNSSRNGFAYTLEFKENDTTDEASPPTFHIEPKGLSRTTGRRGADPNQPVCESRIDATIIDQDDVIYHRLSGSTDKTWQVTLKQDGVQIGVYFLIPDSVQRTSGPDTSRVSFAANDGLAYLSSFAYAPTSGGTYTGREILRRIIQRAVALTGLSRDFVSLANWRPHLTNQLTGSTSPNEHLRIDQGWLVDADGNPYSARGVLEELAGRFKARLFQSDEGWCFVQRAINASWNLSFAWQPDGTSYPLTPPLIDSTTRVEGDDLSDAGTDIWRFDQGGSEGKIPSFREASAAYAHGGLKGSNTVTEGLTGNGSFDIWDEGNNMPDGWRISSNFSSNIDSADISKKSPITAQTGFSLQIDGIYYPNQPSHPNDQGDGWIELDVQEAYWAFTANTTGDTLIVTGHPYSNGDQVQVFSDGTLPAGLSANTTYYVVNSATDNFQVSEEEGGTAIDITDTGTGTHYVHFIDLPYYVEGGVDRHIVWQGRAQLQPTEGALDYTATYDIRVQRYVEGKDHTWYLQEDGTWSIDTEYTMSVGGEATTIGTLPSDYIVAELQDSNGDDVSGVVRMRLYRQEDANTTDGSEPLSAVRFDDFGVLYQETTESKAEPETTYTTVSEDDSSNAYVPDTKVFVIGDGPTAAHQGRLTVFDANREEVMVTGGWKAGTYSGGESSTGYSIDELHARHSIFERRVSMKRRYEYFRLASGVTFPFYCVWQRNISREIVGLEDSTSIIIDGPVDVGRTVTITNDSGDVDAVVLSISKHVSGYLLAVDTSLPNPTIGGTVAYSEVYTPTYLREYFWTGEIEGEFVQYLRDTDDTGLTVTTEKKSGDDADAPTVQRITQSYGGGRVIPSISTLQSSAGGSDQIAHVPEISRGDLFKWESSGTADGGTKFSDGSGGLWSRVYTGSAHLSWWGVTFDDASAAASNTSLITSAISALPAGSTLVLVDQGKTLYTNEFTVSKGIKITGEGTLKMASGQSGINKYVTLTGDGVTWEVDVDLSLLTQAQMHDTGTLLETHGLSVECDALVDCTITGPGHSVGGTGVVGELLHIAEDTAADPTRVVIVNNSKAIDAHYAGMRTNRAQLIVIRNSSSINHHAKGLRHNQTVDGGAVVVDGWLADTDTTYSASEGLLFDANGNYLESLFLDNIVIRGSHQSNGAKIEYVDDVTLGKLDITADDAVGGALRLTHIDRVQGGYGTLRNHLFLGQEGSANAAPTECYLAGLDIQIQELSDARVAAGGSAIDYALEINHGEGSILVVGEGCRLDGTLFGRGDAGTLVFGGTFRMNNDSHYANCIDWRGEGPCWLTDTAVFDDYTSRGVRMEDEPTVGGTPYDHKATQFLYIDGAKFLPNSAGSELVFAVFTNGSGSMRVGRVYAPNFFYDGSLNELSGTSLTDARIIRNSGHPFRLFYYDEDFDTAGFTDTMQDGDRIINYDPSAVGDPEGWVFSVGAGNVWLRFGQVGYRSGSGTPSGSVTPNFIGEKYLDTSGPVWYMATGAANTNWEPIVLQQTGFTKPTDSTGSASPTTSTIPTTALTDSTGGTTDGTLSAISGSGADAGINDNFAEVAAKLDAANNALARLTYRYNTLYDRLVSAKVLES